MAGVIDVTPEPVQQANAGTEAVAAQLGGGGATALVGAALTSASGVGAAASMWAVLPVISGEVTQQCTSGNAALTAHTAKVAETNVQALSATMITNEDNAQALTPHPEVMSV